MSSRYAQRMAQLSARIFGEIRIKNKDSKDFRVIERLKLKPIDKQVKYSADAYPRHQELDHLTLTMRDYGLFRYK
jgi:hypothetical protein